MKTLTIAGREVNRIGYGCMGLSQAYQPCDETQGIDTLNAVLDMGYNHLDTAALYGFGANENLLRKAVGHRRNEYHLASKCGLFKNAEGKREINGRPEVLKQTCDDSLSRLGVEYIDLYYLHRKDPSVPIEESLGALIELNDAGKIGAIGLSEVAPDTLQRALDMTPIAALQSEYSLWSRLPEEGVMDLCRQHNIALVAYSPVARGLLGGALRDMDSLASNDLRHTMPRFQAGNFEANLERVDALGRYAASLGMSLAQASLAWLLAQAPFILPIPGTRFEARALENLQALDVELTPEQVEKIGELVSPNNIAGERYNPTVMREVDAEKWRWTT